MGWLFWWGPFHLSIQLPPDELTPPESYWETGVFVKTIFDFLCGLVELEAIVFRVT